MSHRHDCPASRRCGSFWCITVALLLARPALAVDLGGYLILGQAYTDNIALAPPGSEEEDFITRVTPGITLNQDGKRFDYDVDYYLETLWYAKDSDRNGVYSNLASNALLDVIGKQLQIQGQAAISQVNVTPEKPVSDSNIFVTDNRADATIWTVGPLLRRPLLGQSEIDAYYLYGQVSYDDRTIQDAKRQNAHVAIQQQQEAVAVLDYELVWNFEQIDYEQTPQQVEVQELYLRLGYHVLPELRLTALGGLDSDFRDPSDSSLSESRWEVGMDVELVDNVLSLGVGRRFFGTSYRASWTREVENTRFQLSYSELPTTTDLLSFRQIPSGNPDAEPLPPDAVIDRPGDVGRFIRRRFDASFEWTGYKSAIEIQALWDQREDVTPIDPARPGSQRPDETSYGAGIEYRYLLGQRTTLTANALWRNREYAIADDTAGLTFRAEDDTLLRLFARLDYQLGQRTAAGLQLRFDRRDGTSGGLQDYEQFLVLVDLVRKF
ncbi:MAG: TIGR03016 family PEP-CTERM system-associated outer membrane protein [Gammaproteobacteria bacterium]|nr:MAG: TIGR03016 family PEP-CTERM system-associated outer membrane protein [Gammaproteobacteria bacterium]